MADVGPPRSFPLTTLEQLRDRSYFDSRHFGFNKSSVPLANGPSAREKRPRLLACHDLKGGYTDDQWIQGSQNANAYTLTRWRLLDTFVYFSHRLVTLPPPGWTNAAHRHGVQVLGTFITEWEEGAAICEELLASVESARMYADRLAELAQALGFDGWLINIENAIKHNQVATLQEFVKRLAGSMHALVPQSLVIWYDSVTTEGKLAWQDMLNDLNKPFFDQCDGIFTNYTWKKDYPKQSAIASGERPYDVYMGVDVFGRGTFGGGQFQCDIALKAARDAGVSAALFAPGWSYETGQDEKRWWDSIENCWPAARPDPVQLPFFTDFDIGRGIAKFIGGQQVLDLPWNNLSCQNLQPRLFVTESTRDRFVASTSEGPAVYSGGVCIKMAGDVGDDEVCLVQLYHTDAIFKEALLSVSYSAMVESDANFCLALSARDHKGTKVIHFLLDSDEANVQAFSTSLELPNMSAIFEHAKRSSSITPEVGSGKNLMPSLISGGRLWTVRDFIVEWGQNTLIDIFGICSSAKDLQPILMKLLLDRETIFDGAFVGSGMQTDLEQVDGIARLSSLPPEVKKTPSITSNVVRYMVKLGHISIAPARHVHQTFSDLEWMVSNPLWLVGEGGDKFLSVNLGWKIAFDCSESAVCAGQRYYVYVKVGDRGEDVSRPSTRRFLGMTMLEAFYVYMLPVPRLSRNLTFELQCQCACGQMQPIYHGYSYVLKVPSRDSGKYLEAQPSLSDWLFRGSG